MRPLVRPPCLGMQAGWEHTVAVRLEVNPRRKAMPAQLASRAQEVHMPSAVPTTGDRRERHRDDPNLDEFVPAAVTPVTRVEVQYEDRTRHRASDVGGGPAAPPLLDLVARGTRVMGPVPGEWSLSLKGQDSPTVVSQG